MPKPTPYRASASSSGNTSDMLRLVTEAAYMQTLLTNQDNCPSNQTDSSHNTLCHPVGHHHGHHNHHDHHANNDLNILLPFNVYETSIPTHSHHTQSSIVPEPSHHHNDTNSYTHHTSHDTGSSYGHSSFFNDPSAHHDASSYNHDTSNSFF
ncbi:hypothetical protein [Legionella gresilensis]|uniref:hypothetical protein n=1 Tax=Legionella gresilensis TaxID=91823 RepID=UPI001A9487D2|nr:hypothetical protein [Legionella gresilensis]